MKVKVIIVLAASLVFAGHMFAKAVCAEEATGSKPKIQWTAVDSEQQAARDEWRTDLADFQSKVDKRAALRARTNKGSNQRTEFYAN